MRWRWSWTDAIGRTCVKTRRSDSTERCVPTWTYDTYSCLCQRTNPTRLTIINEFTRAFVAMDVAGSIRSRHVHRTWWHGSLASTARFAMCAPRTGRSSLSNAAPSGQGPQALRPALVDPENQAEGHGQNPRGVSASLRFKSRLGSTSPAESKGFSNDERTPRRSVTGRRSLRSPAPAVWLVDIDSAEHMPSC